MIKNMKTYINVELQIVRVNNHDIITASSINTSTTTTVTPGTTLAPGRRSIWD